MGTRHERLRMAGPVSARVPLAVGRSAWRRHILLFCFGHQGPVAQVGQSHEFQSSPRLHGGCSLFGSRTTRPPSPPPGSCTPDPHPGPAPGVHMGLRLDHFSVAFLGGSHGSQRGSAAQGEDSRWKETRAGTVEGDGSRFGWYLGPQP